MYRAIDLELEYTSYSFIKSWLTGANMTPHLSTEIEVMSSAPVGIQRVLSRQVPLQMTLRTGDDDVSVGRHRHGRALDSTRAETSMTSLASDDDVSVGRHRPGRALDYARVETSMTSLTSDDDVSVGRQRPGRALDYARVETSVVVLRVHDVETAIVDTGALKAEARRY